MKSKLHVLFAAALTLSSVAYAQPDYQFHQTWGSTDNDQVKNIDLTSDEKIIITGIFLETVDFDNGPGTAELTAPGSGYDFSSFILKLSQTGEFEWVKSIIPVSSTGNVQIRSTSLDDQDNIYITGTMDSDTEFDQDSQDTIYEVASGSQIFVAKYDTDGNFLWGKCMGGSSNGYGESIDVDDMGNVYVGGSYSSSIDMTQAGETTPLNSNGWIDGFIIKLDQNGNHVWSHTFGGIDDDRVNTVKVDPSGDILIGGFISGDIDLDPGAGTSMSGATQDHEPFIIKMNSSGEHIWSQTYYATNSYDMIMNFDFKSNQNIVCTGTFNSAVDFGPGIGVNTSTSNGGVDFFLIELEPNGNYVNHFSIGGSGSDAPRNLHIDENDQVYVTGKFASTVDFDPSGNVANESGGTSEAFIVKYDQNWNYDWSHATGGGGYDTGYDVATNYQGALYSVGIFRNTADFDPLGGQEVTSEGDYDIYLQVFGDCMNKFSNETASTCDTYELPWGPTVNQTGFYSDTTQSQSGCDSIVSVDLTVNTFNPTVSNNGMMLTSNLSGDSYQWIDCDNGNTPISGATNQSYTATTDGNYAVIVTINNCSNTSSCTYVSTASLNTWSETVNIYPNPAKDKLNFDLPGDKETFINIYDIQGKTILSRTIKGSESLSVAHLNKGAYFVQVTNSLVNITRRIIIQ